MATPEMLAAVSAAVKGEDPPVVDPAPVADPPAADSPAAEAKEDLIGDPPAGDPPVVEDPPAGQVRGPDGKFKAKEVSAELAAAEPKAAESKVVAPVDPPKPPDHLNDPIPENVKAATRERITSLVETVKTERTEREAAQNDFELIMTPIREAGATVEQFKEAMTLVKLLNSPHQHEQMQALQYLQGAGSQLAERLGQVVPGMDPLAGHNDLIAEVQAGKLTEQRAAEIAQGRRQQAASQRFQQSSQQRSQQEQQRQQEVSAGQAAVRSIEQTLEATDPQYKAKIAVLRADTGFLGKLRSMPPSQWGPAFAEQYRTIKAPAAAAAPAARPNSPAPLRAKTPAGNQAKPPGSMLEAVKGRLASMQAGG